MSEAQKLNLGGECQHCGLLSPSHHASCPVAKATFRLQEKCEGDFSTFFQGLIQRHPTLAAAIAEPGVPYHELICGHPEPEKKQGMKLVYVAGPYRAETREGVAQNVAAARHVGRLCVQKGWFPVLPTINTAHFDHDFPGLADDQYWLDGTLELMRRCDAVVLVDGWQYSSGAKGEIEEARKLGLKVYVSSNVLPELKRVAA